MTKYVKITIIIVFTFYSSKVISQKAKELVQNKIWFDDSSSFSFADNGKIFYEIGGNSEVLRKKKLCKRLRKLYQEINKVKNFHSKCTPSPELVHHFTIVHYKWSQSLDSLNSSCEYVDESFEDKLMFFSLLFKQKYI